MKTNGQILYEYKHPTRIPVVHVNNRHFANAGDVMYMPVHQAPWNLLTEACRQGWEKTAEGHHIFSKEPS
jgi:hypothetical protein